MQLWKKCGALLLAGVTALSLSACSIPQPGFADYDVSGYVRALLDSSYHAEHAGLMAIAGVTEAAAQDNSEATVANAAVRFCNTYGVYPSQQQLEELQLVMKQAFALTRYTVKSERKVEDGYYLEVEIAPIGNFANRQADIDKLSAEAAAEAGAANNPTPAPAAPAGGDEEGEEAAPSAAPPAQRVEPNELFAEKVLDFCKRELANISYDAENVTIPLHILQTDQGELQLDLDEIETIDQMVVRFS